MAPHFPGENEQIRHEIAPTKEAETHQSKLRLYMVKVEAQIHNIRVPSPPAALRLFNGIRKMDSRKYVELPARLNNLILNSGIRLISQLNRLRTLTNRNPAGRN